MIFRILCGLMTFYMVFPIAAKEKLTVLTAYPEDVVARFETAFELANPGIDLAVLWRMPHDALPYLTKPEQGGIDVYWSAGQWNFLQLKQAGAWQKLAVDRGGLVDRLGALPLADQDGYYCATEIAGYGFAVNSGYLSKHDLPVPKTWRDLSDARYSGHVAMPVPSRVGFAPLMIDSVLQQYGWQGGWALLAEIAANAQLLEPGAAFITDIIGRGERGIAPSIDFFVASAQANGAPLAMVYPQPVAYSPAHIAISKATQHAASARRFVAFVLSESGQKLLFHPDIRKLPIRPAVYAQAPQRYFNPFRQAEIAPPSYDPAPALPRLALNNALFDLLLTERHERLQTLWRQLRAQERNAGSGQEARLLQIRQSLTTLPIDAASADSDELQKTFARRANDPKAEAKAQALERAWRKLIDAAYAEAEQLLARSRS